MKRCPLILIVATLAVAAHAGALNPVTQQWVQSFHTPFSGSDTPVGIAVDNHGNAFVAGFETASNFSNAHPNYDFVTLKYSSSGVPLWTNYYDGPVQLQDEPTAMALDRAGNVFVTGFAQVSTTPQMFNYVTIKYSNTGAPLWTNYYNALTNANEQAEAIAIDRSSGAVYVSGIFIGDFLTGPVQYITIKYSNAGALLWTNSFTATTNGFFDDAKPFLAAGKNGTLFVAATVQSETSGEDYATLAYSRNGTPLWTNYYNGPTNGNDHVAGVAVDDHDNVFVTGSSQGVGNFVTIAYSATGTPRWTNIFTVSAGEEGSQEAIAVNQRGEVFVTGNTSLGYGTVAYSGPGVPLWTNFYTAGTNDIPSAVATELNRGVFVTGSSIGAGTDSDFATIEYSSSGVPVSTNRYNNPENEFDYPLGMAVGPNGSVYVTGVSSDTNGRPSITTVKYSPTRGSH